MRWVRMIMAFDECPPYPANREEIQASTARTYRWLSVVRLISGLTKHCLELCRGVYLDLRSDAAQSLAKLDLPGYAIGGVSVGEPPDCQNC